MKIYQKITSKYVLAAGSLLLGMMLLGIGFLAGWVAKPVSVTRTSTQPGLVEPSQLPPSLESKLDEVIKSAVCKNVETSSTLLECNTTRINAIKEYHAQGLETLKNNYFKQIEQNETPLIYAKLKQEFEQAIAGSNAAFAVYVSQQCHFESLRYGGSTQAVVETSTNCSENLWLQRVLLLEQYLDDSVRQ
jgi:hypothetical protein